MSSIPTSPSWVLGPCPWCGAPTEKVVDLIVTPAISPYRDGRPVPPVKKLGAFAACTGCEYCEELV